MSIHSLAIRPRNYVSPKVFWPMLVLAALIVGGALLFYLDQFVWHKDPKNLLPPQTEFWLHADLSGEQWNNMKRLIKELPNGEALVAAEIPSADYKDEKQKLLIEVWQWAAEQNYTQIDLASVNGSLVASWVTDSSDSPLSEDEDILGEEYYLSERIINTEIISGRRVYIWALKGRVYASDKIETLKGLIDTRHSSLVTRPGNWGTPKPATLAETQRLLGFTERVPNSFFTIHTENGDGPGSLFLDDTLNAIDTVYSGILGIVAPEIRTGILQTPYTLGLEVTGSTLWLHIAGPEETLAITSVSKGPALSIRTEEIVRERQQELGEEDSNIWDAVRTLSKAVPFISVRSATVGGGALTSIGIEFNKISAREKDAAEKVLSRISVGDSIDSNITPDLLPSIRDSARRSDAAILENSLAQFIKFSGRAPVELGELVPGFIAEIPKDPQSGAVYVYKNDGSDQTFYVQFVFETDGEWGSAGIYCLTGAGLSYTNDDECKEK